jgi:hypothetical protein
MAWRVHMESYGKGYNKTLQTKKGFAQKKGIQPSEPSCLAMGFKPPHQVQMVQTGCNKHVDVNQDKFCKVKL